MTPLACLLAAFVLALLYIGARDWRVVSHILPGRETNVNVFTAAGTAPLFVTLVEDDGSADALRIAISDAAALR